MGDLSASVLGSVSIVLDVTEDGIIERRATARLTLEQAEEFADWLKQVCATARGETGHARTDAMRRVITDKLTAAYKKARGKIISTSAARSRQTST
jgi:hypothetical protein